MTNPRVLGRDAALGGKVGWSGNFDKSVRRITVSKSLLCLEVELLPCKPSPIWGIVGIDPSFGQASLCETWTLRGRGVLSFAYGLA